MNRCMLRRNVQHFESDKTSAGSKHDVTTVWYFRLEAHSSIHCSTQRVGASKTNDTSGRVRKVAIDRNKSPSFAVCSALAGRQQRGARARGARAEGFTQSVPWQYCWIHNWLIATVQQQQQRQHQHQQQQQLLSILSCCC